MSEIDEVSIDAPIEASRQYAPGAWTPAERPLASVEDAMTLEQASALSGRRGARLVLVMGEPATGKTALSAMLWQRFLEHDGLDGHRLAGSRTVRGFERRAHWARRRSGRPAPEFPPTRPTEAGLLHLRVRRPDSRRVELLLSDLAGELFERVREGRRLVDELPWAPRADRFMVLLDGAVLSTPGASEIAVTRARRLLLSLQAPGVVRDSARVAVVVTKADTLNQMGRLALHRHAADLLAVARHSDPEAALLRTAAIGNVRAEHQGLGELVAWLCLDDRPRTQTVPEEIPGRSIALFRA